MPQGNDPNPPRYRKHEYFIDLGQGDATLLEFPCGGALIDAGRQHRGTSRRLIRYLNGFFDRRRDLNRTLDVVFVTHTHIDHNRAIGALVDPGDPFDAGRPLMIQHFIHNGSSADPDAGQPQGYPVG